MKSFSKKFFILIFTLLYTITFIPYPAQASTSKDIHIIQTLNQSQTYHNIFVKLII